MTAAPTTRKRGPGRPRNQDYDGVILDAAMGILAEDGYQGLTIDGVAARAKVGRPTIYRRWPSKPALVVAALARSTGLAPAPDTGTVRGDLLAVQRHQVALMNSAGWRRITPGLTADLAADPELARTYLEEYIAPRRRSVWDALDRGIARGELPPASTTPSSPTCSPARCTTGPWAAASTSRPRRPSAPSTSSWPPTRRPRQGRPATRIASSAACACRPIVSL